MAREFFQGLYSTALRPAEVLTHVEVPIPGANYRAAFVELARRGTFVPVVKEIIADLLTPVSAFLKIAEQEKLIRENPAERTTEILRKVFGSVLARQ